VLAFYPGPDTRCALAPILFLQAGQRLPPLDASSGPDFKEAPLLDLDSEVAVFDAAMNAPWVRVGVAHDNDGGGAGFGVRPVRLRRDLRRDCCSRTPAIVSTLPVHRKLANKKCNNLYSVPPQLPASAPCPLAFIDEAPGIASA
jgi:hypothetical protein